MSAQSVEHLVLSIPVPSQVPFHCSSLARSLPGASLPIGLSQSSNYSSSSRHDSLPLHRRLPQLTVAGCFTCFALLLQRRPSFASPSIHPPHPHTAVLFGGGRLDLPLIESSKVCSIHLPPFVLTPWSSSPAPICLEVHVVERRVGPPLPTRDCS